MQTGFNRIATTSERIKEAMRTTGKKQADLSRETGIDKGSISHYVSGRYEPKQDAIYKLAAALDVSEMWLWGYDAQMERPQTQKNNDIYSDIVDKLNSDKEFFSAVEALFLLDTAPKDVVPDNVRTLVEFARTVPEDKALMILQVMKSIVEAD